MSDMQGEELLEFLKYQEQGRTDWSGLRGLKGKGSAWPAEDNPVLDRLVDRALNNMRSEGLTGADAIKDAIIHAWYEGHIEGYDHGRRDALPTGGSN